MDDRKLPLLPEPYSRQWINCPFTERLLFTEEQMRAYARAALAAAPAPASVLAYMAVNREGEARFTDNAKAAEELERYGWAALAAAPAPAPLTDEQMRDALRQCPHDTVKALQMRWLYAKDFARAVERAHGIGTDARAQAQKG